MNDFYSDKELELLFGKRETEIKDAIILFDAAELGWLCPVDPAHDITWSEFNEHIWCYDCQKDYFSLLCPKGMNPHTTQTIVKKETQKIQAEVKKWTLEKYKHLRQPPGQA